MSFEESLLGNNELQDLYEAIKTFDISEFNQNCIRILGLTTKVLCHNSERIGLTDDEITVLNSLDIMLDDRKTYDIIFHTEPNNGNSEVGYTSSFSNGSYSYRVLISNPGNASSSLEISSKLFENWNRRIYISFRNGNIIIDVV